MAIKSWADKNAKAVFNGEVPRRCDRNLAKIIQRKLTRLDAAAQLDDLNVPPSNKLEKLKGDRAGQYSFRVNDQFRVCFRWLDGDAYDVEVVDYH